MCRLLFLDFLPCGCGSSVYRPLVIVSKLELGGSSEAQHLHCDDLAWSLEIRPLLFYQLGKFYLFQHFLCNLLKWFKTWEIGGLESADSVSANFHVTTVWTSQFLPMHQWSSNGPSQDCFLKLTLDREVPQCLEFRKLFWVVGMSKVCLQLFVLNSLSVWRLYVVACQGHLSTFYTLNKLKMKIIFSLAMWKVNFWILNW